MLVFLLKLFQEKFKISRISTLSLKQNFDIEIDHNKSYVRVANLDILYIFIHDNNLICIFPTD